MATDQLVAHWMRLRRGYGHLETMGELIDEFVEEHRGRLADEFQFDEGSWWYVAYTVEWPDPSPEWGLLLGEAMHQFRSTLDNLVWILVVANNQRPSETAAFPICRSEAEWNKRVVFSRRTRDIPSPLEGVSPEAFEAIRLRQPYVRGNASKTHPLAKLAWLSNVDKHQVAHVSTLSFARDTPKIYFGQGSRQMLLREYRFQPGKRLHGEAKVELFRVRLPRTFDINADTGKVQVEEFSVDIAFSPRRYLLFDLSDITGEVTDILLRFAQRFFPESMVIDHLEAVREVQDNL